jgi:cytochrome c peroxidase
MIRVRSVTRVALGIACLATLAQCRPERHWEHDLTRVSLDVPTHVTSYVGVELEEPTRAQVELGRHLFHDPLLSADGTVSCASCHLQANGFADPRPFSEGVGGGIGDRNAMAIVNLAFDESFFWDGRRSSLAGQAHDPVVHPLEMAESWVNVEGKLRESETYPQLFFEAFGNLDMDSNQVTQALAAFETTLLSFDAPYDAFFYEGAADALDSAALRGFELFFGEAECVHCHAGPLLTDQTLKSNGLDGAVTDPGLGAVTGLETDLGKFKVPTLRNIAQTAPYMHDGRFATLLEVVEHYNSGVDSLAPNLDPDMHVYVEGLNLTDQQKLDLVAFMASFSDPDFLTNPLHGPPF